MLFGAGNLTPNRRCVRNTPVSHAFIVFAVLFFAMSAATSAFSVDYSELRATAAKSCETIDPNEYRSGLLFNPDGYSSYYVRSQCFQQTAIQFRDETLCSKVKRRFSLFSSSWGYSSVNCRKLVAEGIAADKKILEGLKKEYRQSPIRLRDFRLERNGNGRDFDIIPFFTGSYGHGYILSFELLPSDVGKQSVVIHSSGYYVGGNNDLRIFLRQEDIRKRFAAFSLNRSYRLQATILLDVGHGSTTGYWSDGFIEQVFPVQERSYSMIKKVRF
jgi:hypothetical protein